VHPCPESARCDGPQQLEPGRFTDMMVELKAVAEALDKNV